MQEIIRNEDGSYLVVLTNFNVPNRNGVTYDLEASAEAVQRFRDKVDAGIVYVGIGPQYIEPNNPLALIAKFCSVPLSQVGGKLISTVLENRVLKGRFQPEGPQVVRAHEMMLSGAGRMALRCFLKPGFESEPREISNIVGYNLVPE